jgi:tRNA(Ile2) C34 agmatinyltransferase TiaS
MTLDNLKLLLGIKTKAEAISGFPTKFHPDYDLVVRLEEVYHLIDSTHQATVEEIIKIAEGMKENRRRCRACGKHTLEKSTGLGKITFEFQCTECGNYQEETSVHNQALTELIQAIKK